MQRVVALGMLPHVDLEQRTRLAPSLDWVRVVILLAPENKLRSSQSASSSLSLMRVFPRAPCTLQNALTKSVEEWGKVSGVEAVAISRRKRLRKSISRIRLILGCFWKRLLHLGRSLALQIRQEDGFGNLEKWE